MGPMGGNPMTEAPPKPLDKYKQLQIGSNGSDSENPDDLGNEFKDIDFNIEVFNESSTQKQKNIEYMNSYLDRVSQQMGLIPSEIARTVCNYMGMPPNFVNKYADVLSTMEKKKEQQEQQASQMESAKMSMDAQGTNNKIMGDLAKAMLGAQAKQAPTNTPIKK